MPELPEVQTIISDLNRKIKGDTITDFWSDWAKAIKGKSLDAFKKEIKGRKILGARRIGKNIFIDLSGGKTLYVHLKMTGHLLIKSQIPNLKFQINSKLQKSKSKTEDYFSEKVNSYIHHIWYLKSCNIKHKTCNKTLEFSDVRKFAKIVLDDTEKINNLPEIKKLGVDAMSKKFTLNKFKEILNRRQNKSISLVLMEQELISGIGNIYRSEILFEAGILPTRQVKDLSDKEIAKIYQVIKKVLEKAIKLRGTSDSDYRDTAGAPGNFQKVLQVYRRAGKKCGRCDTIVKRLVLGQRSAFFCSKCQR
jgi:formamidopyrimidine-DNA glycosylase